MLPKRVLLCIENVAEAQSYKSTVGALVRKLGASLVLFHSSRPESVLKEVHPPDQGIFDALIADPAFERIEVIPRHTRTPFDVVTDIDDIAGANHADWIVMPHHARSGLDRLLFGSVTERALRSCKRPVFTFEINAAQKPDDVAFDRIICPMDFSAASEAALSVAAEMAATFQCGITVVHVVEDYYTTAYPLTDLPFLIEYRPKMIESARKSLESVAARVLAGKKVEWTTAVEPGTVLPVVEDVVAAHARPLVVLATSGRDSIGDWVLGSRAERLLRSIKGSVLALPKVALVGKKGAD